MKLLSCSGGRIGFTFNNNDDLLSWTSSSYSHLLQELKRTKKYQIMNIYKYWTKYRGHACCYSPGVQACFLPVSLYLHLKICENPWFRGILTDWCCHADAVTVLMLDGLMIYGELRDAPNESRVNVHLSRQISGCGGLLTSSPDPTVEGTDWVAGLQLNPAHTAGRKTTLGDGTWPWCLQQ